MSMLSTLIAGWQSRLMICASPTSENAIALMAKRTYQITSRGGLSPTEEQPAFRDEGVFDGAEHPVRVLLQDVESFPAKLRTDVVIHGFAYPPVRGACKSAIQVRVGPAQTRVEVLGDRRVSCTPSGHIQFSPARAFDRIELSWRRCYGGIDLSVGRPPPTDLSELLQALVPENHLAAYPRNPAGTGYAVRRDSRALDGLPLPNFEDPATALSPANLILDEQHWSVRPQPRGLGWVSATWYPRSGFVGAKPTYPPHDDDPELFEVREGWVPRGYSGRRPSDDPSPHIDWRFCNGAGPGLRLPHLRGDEVIVLEGLTPEGMLAFSLGNDRPRGEIAMLGRSLDTATQLLSVEIDTEARRVTLVWAIRADVGRALPLRAPRPSDFVFDLLEGIDGWLFDIPVPHQELRLREPDRATNGSRRQ